MKNKTIINGLLGVLLSFTPLFGSAQTGSIKVFTELKEVHVYLDDVSQGIDIILIDSVSPGSHYLKVTKQEVIVYGELVTVKENEVTTVLIKDTKEIQDKLLADKYEEQQKYKELKLDILLSTKYVTETTGQTATTGGAVSLFPGYYSVAAKSETTTVSTTTAVTDWFITEGATVISERQFATITNNTSILTAYENYDIEMNKEYRRASRNSRIAMILVGAGIGVLGGICINNDNFKNDGVRLGATIMGAIFAAGGTAMVIIGIVTPTGSYMYTGTQGGGSSNLHLISFDDALKQVRQYNQNLKKQLGLPENYEPAQ